MVPEFHDETLIGTSREQSLHFAVLVSSDGTVRTDNSVDYADGVVLSVETKLLRFVGKAKELGVEFEPINLAGDSDE
jgi:hypothetical protein